MTDRFKNLTIDTVVNEDGQVTSITLPVSGKVLNLIYDDEGGISDVQGEDGNTLDMSDVIGAVGVPAAIYSADLDNVDDPMVTEDSSETTPIADKIIDMNGKLVVLEYDEKGRLTKEVNSKFTSYYFLKETRNYGPLCANRLAYLYGTMTAMVREAKTTDGTIVYEEALFGNVLSRTKA